MLIISASQIVLCDCLFRDREPAWVISCRSLSTRHQLFEGHGKVHIGLLWHVSVVNNREDRVRNCKGHSGFITGNSMLFLIPSLYLLRRKNLKSLECIRLQ